MSSRILIATLSAAAMAVAAMAPVTSSAQTSQPSSIAQTPPPPHSLSEGTALQAPKVAPSQAKTFSGAASAEPTAPKKGETLLAPVAKQ